jgi:hypothetical protein
MFPRLEKHGALIDDPSVIREILVDPVFYDFHNINVHVYGQIGL